MTVRGAVRAGLYLDSIFLMQVSDRIARAPGIRRASAVMATTANKGALAAASLADPAFAGAGPDDLIVVVEGETEEAAVGALARIDEWLTPPRDAARRVAASLDEAVDLAPHATVVCISVPGEHAAAQAAAALERGLHAFIFSSGVSMADEVALKGRAHERGLLVMGPDCGTVMLGGAGLGFANAVRSGPIGIVGATGTGIQEIVTLVHRWGGGVSHAIGTGSRDPWDEVGGISTFDALDALAQDPATTVIVVASKPPGERTLRELLSRVARMPKPVVVRALGAGEGVDPASGAGTLEDAAWRAFVLAYGRPPAWSDGTPADPAPLPRLEARQRSVRGLFSGGTLAAEAQAILGRLGIDHTVVDLGAEELVQGKPHPMIDPGPRREQMLRAAHDPEVGVLLFDVVLGFGAAADPAGDLAPSIVEARSIAQEGGRHLAVVASVTGTEEDPQVRSRQRGRLEEAGALVAQSAAEAARLAACVVEARATSAVGVAETAEGASVSALLRRPPAVINVGAAHFAESLREQGIEVVEVGWRPPPSDEVGRALERLL